MKVIDVTSTYIEFVDKKSCYILPYRSITFIALSLNELTIWTEPIDSLTCPYFKFMQDNAGHLYDQIRRSLKE